MGISISRPFCFHPHGRVGLPDRAGMKASYIITFRKDHGRRLANLIAVLDWLSWFQDMEVVLVEQDAVYTLEDVKLPSNCGVVFARNAGPFNKAWGFNVGYRHAGGNVLAFGDADMIMKRGALAACFEACRRRSDAINPYDNMIDLTPEESEIIFQGNYDVEVTRRIEELNRTGKGEFTCFCGGIFLIRRTAFEVLGGFDERFLGWGGEDDAMTLKLLKVIQNIETKHDETAYHLWHERSRSAMYGHAHYQNNLRLIAEYRFCLKDDLIERCKIQSQSMGDIQKYAATAPGISNARKSR